MVWAVVVAACGSSGPDALAPATTSSATDLDDVYEAFARGYAELDADLVAGLYTKDAVYLPPSSEIRRGRAQIRDGFARMFDRARARGERLAIEFDRSDRRISGDLAFEVGIFTLTRRSSGKPDRISRGKFTVVLFRGADGAWRFHVDAYSGLGDEPTPHRLAAGEPYVDEIARALLGAWVPPDGVAGDAMGCVRLREDGTAKESWVWPAADDESFNAAVQSALDAFSGLGSPVPDHLLQALVTDGACVRFRRAEQP